VTPSAAPPPISREEGRVLLRVARDAVLAAIAAGRQPEPAAPADLTERLRMPQGAFVTLHVGGRLRGCIGMVEPLDPLWQAVRRCAIAAAFEDPRFPPLTGDEVDALDIDVSVLGPPRVLLDVSEVRVGRDGLIVSLGRRRGLLLPQVASEHGWDAGTFVRETCRKAGLEPDAVSRGARLEAFEAQVFAERPDAGPGRAS
jgi:AmmeMemoRadiSam system protein A